MAGEDFDRQQRETAQQLGYGGDVAAMNRDHDPLHAALCRWLGVTSHALRDAGGEALTAEQRTLALHEEAAVLAVQTFVRLSGADFAIVPAEFDCLEDLSTEQDIYAA